MQKQQIIMVGFRFTRLDKRDYTLLIILLVLVVFSDIYFFFSDDYSTSKGIQYVISFGISWITFSSGFGLRFRNFYFSLIWMILCLKIYIFNSDTLLPLLPFLSFMNYQIVRAIYWFNYGKEFIPLLIYTRVGVDFRFSKLENRKANKSDKTFSIISFILGLIIFMIYAIITN
jgi:hypothetical protein